MQNILYDNPPTDPPCGCPRCLPSLVSHMTALNGNLSLPSGPGTPSSIREPTSASGHEVPSTSPAPGCLCSGCTPEPLIEEVASLQRPKADANPVPRKDRLTKEMRAEGMQHLRDLRGKLYRATCSSAARALPPDIFLPDVVIKLLLDRFALINSEETLQEMISGRIHLLPHSCALWESLQALDARFEEMRRSGNTKAKPEAMSEGMASSERVPEARTFEACCSSFQIKLFAAFGRDVETTVSLDSPQSGDLTGGVFEWNINTPLKATHVDLPDQAQASSQRKRSSTTSTINPRPRAKARVGGKENRLFV
ncbi:hypothetical protein NUW54_g3727 [Trametes sanguinea]|uniref:Uncharacterized protein n=1 Tax=Trametes sanguinea TaxID=158606 RepID=A0ACC1PZZ0_9APHY|nr:hypothetical protein NUW54_g3727 [Trametes sanguinea]